MLDFLLGSIWASSSSHSVAMAPQLAVAEQSLIDKILRQDEGNGADALAVVNAARSKKKLPSIVVTQCVAND